MRQDLFLPSPTARQLYDRVRDCPIYDYHCHLSPREIWEDRPFDNLGELWLAGDHYKWRLMRAAGIPEEQITGSASWHEKFLAYAQAIACAAGNPLYHWTQMELSRYFGIETPLGPDTAEEIWTQASRLIRERELSPRKLIALSGVAYIGTTDDITDSLDYHQRLCADSSLPTTVAPTFRLDGVLLLDREDYRAYIDRLEQAAGLSIGSLEDLRKALVRRLDTFSRNGCRFADVGIPLFPDETRDPAAAERTFAAARRGEPVAPIGWMAFLWEMYLFLGGELKRRGIILQLHLAVQRNVNTRLFRSLGTDCGGDCIGDPIPGSRIAALLDAWDRRDALPRVILYTLHPSMTAQLAAIAGSFRDVRLGTAWWFNDHKRGISETIRTIAEVHHLGEFLGMITDSRSFLSYARHDYFRRILCGILAEWQDSGEFCGSIEQIARAICFQNIQDWIEKGEP